MTPDADALLAELGLKGPALAALEGPSGLFALSAEELVYSGERGTRRVHLRDLARIHSDAEGILRVETPAGVALRASLLGFEPGEVQHFFEQVQAVTARAKATGAPRPAPPGPGAGVTPPRGPDVRGSDARAPQEITPRITVTRRGQIEEMPPTEVRPTEPRSTELRPAPGSVRVRMLSPEGGRSGEDPPPLIVQAAPPQSALTRDPDQDEQMEQEPQNRGAQDRQSEERKAPRKSPTPPAELMKATPRDLAAQATRVDRQAGLLRVLGAVLIVGSLVAAVLMFLNAQRPLALWALVQGAVLGVALLGLAELFRLHALQAALAARQAEGGG